MKVSGKEEEGDGFAEAETEEQEERRCPALVWSPSPLDLWE